MTRGRATRRGVLLGTVAGTSGFGLAAPAVVLPTVADALGIGDDATAWVLASFVLGAGSMMTIGGRALDVHGPRRVAAAGVAATVIGTILTLLAGTLLTVSAGRLIQGVGSALLCITAFGAVAHIDLEHRARAGGVLTATSFLCIAGSPLVGALLEAVAGWRVALCCGALILLPVPAMLRGMPLQDGEEGELDVRGASIAAIASILLATVLQAPATGIPLGLTAILALVTAAALAGLARHVRATPEGFLPVRILRNRELMELSVTASTVQAAYVGLSFAVPILLAREAGWTPLQTGVGLMPCAAVAVASATLAGTAGARLGAARVFVLCCALSLAGVLVVAAGTTVPVAVILGSVIAIAPYAAVQATMLGRVSTLVDPEETGAATGVFTYVFITGGAVGAALAGGLSSLVGLTAAVAGVAVLPLAGLTIALRVRAREGRAVAT